MTGAKRPGEVLKRHFFGTYIVPDHLTTEGLTGVVWGEPRPWTRPGRKGNRYFPRNDAFWTEAIRAEAISVRPEKLLEGPLFLMLHFRLMKPEGKDDKALPDVKPDIDNLEKIFLDVCEKILYKNDAQVTAVDKKKRYIPPGFCPYLEFFITRDIEPLF